MLINVSLPSQVQGCCSGPSEDKINSHFRTGKYRQWVLILTGVSFFLSACELFPKARMKVFLHSLQRPATTCPPHPLPFSRLFPFFISPRSLRPPLFPQKEMCSAQGSVGGRPESKSQSPSRTLSSLNCSPICLFPVFSDPHPFILIRGGRPQPLQCSQVQIHSGCGGFPHSVLNRHLANHIFICS